MSSHFSECGCWEIRSSCEVLGGCAKVLVYSDTFEILYTFNWQDVELLIRGTYCVKCSDAWSYCCDC